MDRFTLAGILTEIQDYFDIGDERAGLLQTAFVLSYMLFAPVFGYLGDRYSRRFIMAFGVLLWSLTTLIGSFMENFTGFIIFRALVGIGEASYSTIAPTIISDMFVKDVRSKMLALFYFAIPVGSGLGYIVGSETARAAARWQWGLRVTPIMGAVAVLLIMFVMKDPARGESEGSDHLVPTSWSSDIRALARNASFMLSTAGFTCVAFVAGALAWWGPKFIYLGIKLQPGNENIDMNDVSYKFGLLAMMSGIIGVPLGSMLAQRLRPRYPRADPVICAVGLLTSAPLVYCALLAAASPYTGLCYTLIFLAELFLNMNWSIVADVLLYVVIPTRRSTAEAFQILMSHALGDAGSPYLIGVISEALKVTLATPVSVVAAAGGASVAALTATANMTGAAITTTATTTTSTAVDDEVIFRSLQYALFTTCFVEVLGGFFFLCTALYILRDKMRVEQIVNGDMGQPKNVYADDTLTEVDQRRNLVS